MTTKKNKKIIPTIDELKKGFLDYWYEFDQYIPFPKTPNSINRINDFLFLTFHNDSENNFKYDFCIAYVGNDYELIQSFEKLKKNSWYNYISNTFEQSTIEFNSIKFFRYKQYHILNDKLQELSLAFLSHYLQYNLFPRQSYYQKHSITNIVFNNFLIALKKEVKRFKTIRNVNFEKIFGKTLQEYIVEAGKNKQQYSSIGYTALVGEAYTRINNLKDSCEILLKSLQNGSKTFDYSTYREFKKNIVEINDTLGKKNNILKTQIQKGLIKEQSLFMFLRDHSIKPIKPKK